jgi:hypothetical protein
VSLHLQRPESRGSDWRYQARHIERFPLGTPYPEICRRVVTLFAEPPLARSVLAVDQTGVGQAVVEMLMEARPNCTIQPILITSGHNVTRDDGVWHVPKKELVSVLQILLQTRRLAIAKQLPLAEVLATELQNFRVKITLHATEVFEAWRDSDHDDLVLALAMAAWIAEQDPPRPPPPPPIAFGGYTRW